MIYKLKAKADRAIELICASKKAVTSPYGRLSFGQEGEDIVLAKILQFVKKGFYVDVGAHHPEKYSNTAHFYSRGWTGINIDPIPGTKALFDEQRPRDINIEIGISDKEETLPFYMFDVPAYNTFSAEKAERVKKLNVGYKGETQIQLKPLAAILDQYMPAGKEIDFLTVDVETLDLQVLQSNNWDKYRPKLVLAEMLNNDLSVALNDPVTQFMMSHDYRLFSKTVNTAFFIRNDYDHTKP